MGKRCFEPEPIIHMLREAGIKVVAHEYRSIALPPSRNFA